MPSPSLNLFIHLFFYVGLFTIVGLIKPDWVLFFLKKPSRLIVMYISIISLMIVTTFYGSWNKERILKEKQTTQNAAIVSEVPEAK